VRLVPLALLLAACETTPTVTNALDGGIGCGALACGPDELCVDQAAGIDAGTGSLSCWAVPKDCEVFNCSGARCAPCIRALCTQEGVQLSGRNVDCPGQ
jgi:hypothetical protein